MIIWMESSGGAGSFEESASDGSSPDLQEFAIRQAATMIRIGRRVLVGGNLGFFT